MNFRYLIPQDLFLRVLSKSLLLRPLIQVLNFPFLAGNVISLWDYKWHKSDDEQ